MNQEERWLESLPSDAPERQLLLVAESECPTKRTVERGWQALSLSLGLASAAATASVSAAASTATSGAAASTVASTSATVAGAGASVAGAGATVAGAGATVAGAGATVTGVMGLSVITKSVVIGFVVGMGALGTGHVVRQVASTDSPAVATAAVSSRPLPARLPSVKAVFQPAESSPPVPVSKPSNVALPPTVAIPREPRAPTLSEQAQELARLKRLLDSGAANEALTSLQSSISTHSLSALAEDRDALYIEALAKTHRQVEAQQAAGHFFSRYPSSPHHGKIRALFEAE